MKEIAFGGKLVMGVTFLLASACGGDDGPDLDLLAGRQPPSSEKQLQEERARLKQLQLVLAEVKGGDQCGRDVDNLPPCTDPVTGDVVHESGVCWPEIHLDTWDYTVKSYEITDEVLDEANNVCRSFAVLEAPASTWGNLLDNQCGREASPDLGQCFLSEAMDHVCLAHKLREFAGARTSTVLEEGSFGIEFEYSLRPPPTSGAVALLKEAVEHSQSAAVSALNGLKAEEYTTQDSGGTSCGTASQYASTLVEAYHYYQELTDEAVDAVVSVADAQRSWSSSLQQGVEWSVGGIPNPDENFGNLSRSEGAHMMVGGDPGLYVNGEPVGGFCNSPQLSGQAQKAIRLIREAAPSPKDLLAISGAEWMDPADDSVSVDEFVNGPLPSGSLRKRLSGRYPELDTPAYSAGIEPFFKLEQADFVEARRYLADEIRTFARSLDAVESDVGTDVCQDNTECPVTGSCQTMYECWTDGSPCMTDADCSTGECIPGLCELPEHEKRYLATAVEPQPLPNVYWSAIASQGPGDPYIQVVGRPDLSAVGNVAAFTDAVISEAQELTANPGLIDNADDRAAIVNVLTLLIEGGIKERPYRVYYSSSGSGAGEIVVFGLSSTDNARLIFGEDALRCTTQGTIEGSLCEVGGLVLDEGGDSIEPGWESVAQVSFSDAPVGERWYVVKPRSPSQTGPGNFDAIVGGVVPAESGDTVIPVVPRAIDRAAEVLRPSRKWCTHQKVTCAGTDFDERLPLENELNDDGDNVESSWRHYLSLARQAADEADALGQDYVAAGLDVSQRGEAVSIREKDQRLRAESELEALQDICGTTIETEKLLEQLSVEEGEAETEGSDSDASAIRTSNSSCPDTACGEGQLCLMGTCVWDPVLLAYANPEDPNLARLAECIGNATDLAYVTPGNSPLCFYLANGNRNYPCHNATEQCPTLPEDAEAIAYGDDFSWGPFDRDKTIADVKAKCTTLEVPDPTVDEVEVAIPLGYFDSLRKPIAVSRKDWACDAVRQLRYGLVAGMSPGKRDNLLNTIIGSGIFSEENLRLVAGNASWQPHHAVDGGGSTVILSGVPKFSTNDLGLNLWPCGVNCPEERAGLMCYDCSAGTHALDKRLARAVIAARLASDGRVGNTINGISLPLYFFPQSSGVGGNHFSVLESHLSPVDNRKIYRSSFHEAGGIFGCATSAAEARATNNDFCIYFNVYNPEEGNAFDIAWGDVPTLTSDGGVFAIGVNALVTRYFADGLPDMNLFGGLAEEFGGGTEPGWLRRVYEGRQDVNAGIPDYFGPGESGVTSSLVSQERRSSDPAFTSVLDPEQVLTAESLLDAAELVCELSDAGIHQCDMLNPPKIQTIDDLPKAKAHLQCMADNMEVVAAHSVFANMPERAIQPLRAGGGTGAYPTVGGQIGAAISRLRAELIHITEIVPMAAHEVRLLGNDIEGLGLFVEGNDLSSQLIDVNRMSTEMAETAACDAARSPTQSRSESESVSGGVSIGFPPSVSISYSNSISEGRSWNPGAAAATCANKTSQIGFAIDRAALENAQLENNLAVQLNSFQEAFETRSATLFGYSQELQKSAEEIDAKLAEIEALRNKAERALYRALFVSSFQAENQEKISAAMRARRDVTKVRYDRAFDNAQRTAFLAKRAIEQRLGFHLSEMKTDLPLVEAPSKWEAEVCTLSGLDYSSFEAFDGEESTAEDISKQFIGDYVSKLENLIESYQLTFNFHEGADTAVVSLRDDIQQVRDTCEVEADNLLYHSGAPDRLVPQDSGERGWRLANCAEEVVAAGSTFDGVLEMEPIPDCITVLPHAADVTEAEEVEGEVAPVQNPNFGTVTMYDVYFGLDGTPCVDASGEPSGECGYLENSELYQDVSLEKGTYRLSWYGADDTGAAAEGLVRLVEADPSQRGAILDVNPVPQSVTHNGVPRSYYTVEVGSAVDARVIITKPSTGSAWSLGGIMLEDITNRLDAALGPFVETTGTLTRGLPMCEDTDGDVFRAEGWTRGCTRLCSNGFEGECSGSNAETHCYWETSFTLNQRAIESNEQLVASGFARGNFNYRIDSVGINFVGAGTRDCENSDTPSTCYAAGFIPYSLRHEGPYFVRNHIGQQFEAKLFSGNIEHARGLAGERYLTNPLSDADRTLIEPYFRQEFSGRPIDGNYSVRVWDEAGVDFDAIQDVQIVLNYRYWTRFE